MSIQSDVWGPVLWSYFHMWSLSYPIKPTQDDKLRYSKTFISVLDTLPCSACLKNKTQNLIDIGFAQPHTPERFMKTEFMTSQHTFTKFLFDFHNLISKNLQKPESTRTYSQTMHDLSTIKADCKTKCSTKIVICSRKRKPKSNFVMTKRICKKI